MSPNQHNNIFIDIKPATSTTTERPPNAKKFLNDILGSAVGILIIGSLAIFGYFDKKYKWGYFNRMMTYLRQARRIFELVKIFQTKKGWVTFCKMSIHRATTFCRCLVEQGFKDDIT